MVAQAVRLYMLDTCVCTEILRGRAPVGKLPSPQDCCLSSIVTAELRTGLLKGPASEHHARRLDGFIESFQILPFDESASQAYAEIRADLKARGLPIGPLDLLIAAHARSVGATLITANVAEFRRVRSLKLLAWRTT